MLNGNVNDISTKMGLGNSSASDHISINDVGIDNDDKFHEIRVVNDTRLGSFSETLKILDDNIIADLSVH